jgi:NTE family protein
MAFPEEPVSGAQKARRSRDLDLGLCLSGGGYRAMLFHGGALARLNELGWLRKLDAISSVSGGSIAAGLLGSVWPRFAWNERDVATNFDDVYLRLLLEFSQTTADFSSIAYGVSAPWTTASKQVAKRYRSLFGFDANLRTLPNRPRFIFCASNLTTGSLFRFSKRYLADYRLGQHFEPDIHLAIPVAASAAFPPALSPLRLDLRPFNFEMRPGDGEVPPSVDPALLQRAVLTDGGVYDNHALQPLLHRCRMLLVSDGGAPWSTSRSGFYRWTSQLKRVLYMTDNQVRALRRQDLIGRFIGSADRALDHLPAESEVRQYFSLRGTYWAISTDPTRYPAEHGLLAEEKWTRLAGVGTWLHFLGDQETEDLVNWGYLMSDLALRSYVDPSIPAGTALPVASGSTKAGWRARAAKWFGDLISNG